MRDGPRVGVVHHASQLPACHGQRHGQQLGQHRHGVWNVDDLVVLNDFGDEVTGVDEVAHDGHADTQDEHIGEFAEHLLDVGLGVGVVGATEVGNVVFGESRASNGVGIIVVEDASGAVVGHVDAVQVADVSEVQAADDVGTDGLDLFC